MQRSPRVLFLLTAALAGCDERVVTACPDIGIPRFWVRVTDARTGAPVPGALVRDSLTGGTWADRRSARLHSVRLDTAVTGEAGFVGLGGRGGGTFAVVVAARGYAPWRQGAVRVDADAQCGIPTTVSLSARLTPSER